MDRTRTVARSLISTATVVAASLAPAATPAAYGAVSPLGVTQHRLLDDGSPEANGRPATPSRSPELLAKAIPDECFGGVGPPSGWRCDVGQPKVNQSYVWGLTRAGDNLWFGTAANVQCLTIGASFSSTNPIRTDDYVCEFGESPLLAQRPTIPAAAGDWRPPKAYIYHTRSGKLTDKTGAITGRSKVDKQRWESTVGIRAAGTHRGVVLLAGPSLRNLFGINLFAFDAKSGKYLGSTTLTGYGNIRNFVVADGVLYAGVGVGPDGQGGGAVLRWSGSKAKPFAFDVVGRLPAQVADLAVHKGRLYVSTWPSLARGVQRRSEAGIWMSPRLTAGKPGLTKTDANSWKQVWSVSEYEPDPVVAATYGLGGLASYQGHLYWGTMHVPMKAMQAHSTRYEPQTEEQSQLIALNAQRTLSIFRLGDPAKKGKGSVELLYGAAKLPAYDAEKETWRLTSTGYTPRFGPSGFGNGYNNYTWKMVVTGNKLYVGTMDWSYLSKDLSTRLRDTIEATLGPADPASYGADLWAFDNPGKPAKPVDTTGVGNYLNYGIRTMAADSAALYLGTANPMNLRTDLDDDIPEGGWELVRVPVAKAKPTGKK